MVQRKPSSEFCDSSVKVTLHMEDSSGNGEPFCRPPLGAVYRVDALGCCVQGGHCSSRDC